MSQPDESSSPQTALPTQQTGSTPQSRGGAATTIFVILTILFFLAAAGLGGLYYTSKKSADKKIADQKAQIATLQHDATANAGKLTQMQKDLDAAKSDAAGNADCVTAVQSLLDAIGKNDQNAATAAAIQLAAKCKGVHTTTP